jgi:hypothetical protein
MRERTRVQLFTRTRGGFMSYYVVNAGRGRSTHVSMAPVPGLAITLLAGAPSTLCGLPATRQVDAFTPAEVSCRECRRRWKLAMRRGPHRSRLRVAMEAVVARRQRDIETGRLDRSAAEVIAAGGSARAARRYERDSGSWRRSYLRRHRDVARRLFPDGVPEASLRGDRDGGGVTS